MARKVWDLENGYNVVRHDSQEDVWVIYHGKDVVHVGDAASTLEFLRKKGWALP